MNNIDSNMFIPVYDLKIAKDYDGFIAPDGGFYKVSKKNKHNPSHIALANEYVINKLDYVKLLANPTGSFLYTISRLKNKQDILIHFYGYVYYGHDAFDKKPIIIYPDETINGVSANSLQLNILFNILRDNDELSHVSVGVYDNVKENKYQSYKDNYISNLLDRRK